MRCTLRKIFANDKANKIIKNGKMIFFIGMMGICFLSGCTPEENPAAEINPTIYRFGKEDITYSEVFIYANTIKENYENTYGVGIWSVELEDTTGEFQSVESVTRRDIVNCINRVKILVSQADKYDVSLSEDNRADIKARAKEFYEGLTEKDLAESDISLPLAEKVYEENTIAAKIYKKIFEEQDFEVSEEEARMTTFFDIVFECYTMAEDGTITPFTEEQKAEQLNKANAALNRLATEDNVDAPDIVTQYQLQYANTYTLSKIDIVHEYGQDIADTIFTLSNGGFSTVVESDYGYHIFKMVHVNNEDLTKENKLKMTEDKEKEYFATLYEEWLKEYAGDFDYNKDVNLEAFEKIILRKD